MKVVYPGSFDPVTNGHLDIIDRASKIFDQVVVGVLVNTQKNGLFEMNERIEMLNELLYDYNNITVELFEGLLVDFCEQQNANAIVRGLRAVSDYENELQLAHLNSHLSNGKYETLFMAASPEVSYLSSSAVREIAQMGGNITALVPAKVAEKTIRKYQGR